MKNFGGAQWDPGEIGPTRCCFETSKKSKDFRRNFNIFSTEIPLNFGASELDLVGPENLFSLISKRENVY